MTRITMNEITDVERYLGVKFPKSYREFLIQQGTAEIAGYTILGIPKEEKKEQKAAEKKPEQAVAEKPVTEKPKPAIKGLPTMPELSDFSKALIKKVAQLKQKKQEQEEKEREQKEKQVEEKSQIEKKELSVAEAAQFLWKKRSDLAGKKLIPIFFKQDLNTGAWMALCMDLSKVPEDDAPLVLVPDINRQTEPVRHDPGSFSEWLCHIQKMRKRHEFFKIAFQKASNRNNEVLEHHLSKAFDKMFGQKCPICQIRERKVIVFEKTQGRKTLLTCEECENEWKQLKRRPALVKWVEKKLEGRYNLPSFTEKGTYTVHDKKIRGEGDEEKETKHIHLDRYDWRTRIFRVTDHIVGIIAFRYSQKLGCLEVDAFWSGDLAGYAKGQAIRNLAIAVFSEANSLTGSLAVNFTRDIRENEKTGKITAGNWRRKLEKIPDYQKEEAEKNNGRIRCLVPQELIDFAEANYILLSQAEQGIISHQDGLNLFWAALGWPEHLQAKVDELEKKGYLTKQALASVIYAGIWSKEEAVWLFENAPRPEAILLGSDLPEDRLYYTESLAWGRSAYLANLLRTKVSADIAGGLSVEEREESDCELESYGGFWLMKSARDFTLPWMIKNSEPVLVKTDEPVLILSMPCQTTQEANDLSLIKEGFKVLKETQSPAKIRCLLVGFEFSDLKYGMKVAEFMKENSKKLTARGVHLMFSPYRLDLLNDEVENRMFSARRKRQFPSRRTPLCLQLIEIPEARWQKPDLLYSVQDAQSAAYWIEKKIDLRLGRIRFRVNCNCIERIAVQDASAKVIAVADRQNSKDILAAMISESGIVAPFVPPDEMLEFVKKVGGKLRNVLKIVKGGLVAVTSLEKSEASETAEVSPATEKTYSVNSGFQFPVDPSDVDLANYAVKRREEIARTHRQIQQALRTGEPLAVSYLRHEVFVEAIREYLFKKGRMDQVNLRIVYNDGGVGRPFPLFCLAKRQRPKNLYQMKVGSISMRHAALDLATDGYLIQNIMISKRKLSSAEQEDYAFRQTSHFLSDFVDLVKHKRLEELFKEIRFKYLWNVLKLEGKKSKGCELHIFQTGLVPATVGIYRAVVKFLQERRGELIVVPRLIGKKAETAPKERETIDAAYLKAAEWF